MEIRNGTKLVKTIPGRHIVYSFGDGKLIIDEVKEMCKAVLKCSNAWKTCGWALISDVQNMDPVDSDTDKGLVQMIKYFTENGCKAFAFIDSTACMLKAQTKSHQKRSSSAAWQGHFSTLEEALEWLQQLSF
jgi:hypothetical protein